MFKELETIIRDNKFLSLSVTAKNEKLFASVALRTSNGKHVSPVQITALPEEMESQIVKALQDAVNKSEAVEQPKPDSKPKAAKTEKKAADSENIPAENETPEADVSETTNKEDDLFTWGVAGNE